MRFAKQVSEAGVRFARIKRRGTKNCRVVWLDNQHEELLSLSTVEECSAQEAGYNGSQATSEATGDEQPGMTGEDLIRLMRGFQVSTRELASRLNVPPDVIRNARNNGLDDLESVQTWTAAIQNPPVAA